MKKIRVGEKVKILSGKDKGKIGKVIKIFVDKDRILIEGINVVKRHVKPGVVSKEGGIISVERPVHISNVMYHDEKSGRPVRVGSKIIDSKKYRINKKSGETL